MGDLPQPAWFVRLDDAVSGPITLAELRRLVHGRIAPEAVWELKCQTLRKSGLLSLYRGQKAFDDLGGVTALKAFCRRSLLSRCQNARRF